MLGSGVAGGLAGVNDANGPGDGRPWGAAVVGPVENGVVTGSTDSEPWHDAQNTCWWQ